MLRRLVNRRRTRLNPIIPVLHHFMNAAFRAAVIAEWRKISEHRLLVCAASGIEIG
jgi:hypothetical protein